MNTIYLENHINIDDLATHTCELINNEYGYDMDNKIIGYELTHNIDTVNMLIDDINSLIINNEDIINECTEILEDLNIIKGSIKQ